MLYKVLAALLVLLAVDSYKYLPLAYTIRFYNVVIGNLYFRKFKPTTSTSVFAINTRQDRCCILECDLFGLHKNNVTYFTDLDIARTDCALRALSVYFQHCQKQKKGSIPFVPLASITNHFLKEIKPFQKYNTMTKIVGWGDKWVWLITLFTTKEVIKISQGSESKFDYNSIVEIGESAPDSIPPLYTGYHKGDKVGERVMCVSIAKLVFKRGRETVAPSEIMRIANANGSDSGNDIDSDKAIDDKGRAAAAVIAKEVNNPVVMMKLFEQA